MAFAGFEYPRMLFDFKELENILAPFFSLLYTRLIQY